MSNLEQMMMDLMIKNNPQLSAIMKEIEESGKTPQELFYQKAKEKGINPEDILSKLR